MHIWVDADSCPNVIKEILFRAVNRTKIYMTLVANQPIKYGNSPFIKNIQVSMGFDVADNYIVKHLKSKDLVITGDLPLASAVIDKGAIALNPRGELYSNNNIKQRLSIRNFSENLRSSGMITHGPDKISKRDIQTFANNLDKILHSF